MLGKRRAAKAEGAERARQVAIDRQTQCTARRERLRLARVEGWPTDDCNTPCGAFGQRPCDRTGA